MSLQPLRGLDSRRPIVRGRDLPERLELALKAEFKRCGWPTNKVKVRAFRPVDYAPPVLVLNLGSLRGLDAAAALKILQETTLNGKGEVVKRFADKCGQRKIVEALARLPQRIETGETTATEV